MASSFVDILAVDKLRALKVIVPIVAGTVSLAYFAAKMSNSNNSDKDIPTVSLKDGAKTHDEEYLTNPHAFMKRCEQECGPVFNVNLMNRVLTFVSGPQMTREFYMHEELNSIAAMTELMGLHEFLKSLTKSYNDMDSMIHHLLVRDFIIPNVNLYTPVIVRNLQKQIETQFEKCNYQLVSDTDEVVQRTVAYTMATVFMGEEIGQKPEVVDTFTQCIHDFNKLMGSGDMRKSTWRNFSTRSKFALMSPMHRHVKVLVDASTPVILRRRKEEAEQGEAYVRPDDVLQKILDNAEAYKIADIEDVYGHLIIMILGAVHTTAEQATNQLYYLAQYPEYLETLNKELQEVIDEHTRNAEELAAKEGNMTNTPKTIDLTDVLTPKALKKMVHLDSFVREVLRHATDLRGIVHFARKPMTFSNGVHIPKGRMVTVSVYSAQNDETLQGPDPAEFRPWRFAGKGKSASKVDPGLLLFGMGKHACPGRFLAVQEVKVFTCLMIHSFSKFEMEDPSKGAAALYKASGAPRVTGLYLTRRH